jgi:hypothetical protein
MNGFDEHFLGRLTLRMSFWSRTEPKDLEFFKIKSRLFFRDQGLFKKRQGDSEPRGVEDLEKSRLFGVHFFRIKWMSHFRKFKIPEFGNLKEKKEKEQMFFRSNNSSRAF